MAFRQCGLERLLRRLDGRGYRAYRELKGCITRVDGFEIRVVRVQPDPYAPPSVVHVMGRLEAPDWALEHPVALADYLYRRLYRALRSAAERMGEGRSGFLSVPRPSPVMLRRSGLEVSSDGRFIARIWVGLPSRRRRVLGNAAMELLLEKIPRAIRRVVEGLGGRDLEEHIRVWRLQEELRSSLPRYRLVAFVGDGSILPRRCGTCEDPLPGAVPFESPPSLRVEIETSVGAVTGMGVPRGVTVIAGTAFHGKTTLLEAIQYGIYNHVPGDGRERVVSLRSTVKVRAEDGRYVSCVDISTFIHSLPARIDTSCFTTWDASGATSMAAAVQEAVEAGAEAILIDEDTSATNLLFYDERSASLIRRKTVTTIAEQAKSMSEKGVSLVIVSSGSAPLLAAADTVVVMEDYRPRDATREAKQLATQPGGADYKPPSPRRLVEAPRLEKPRIRETWLVARNLPSPLNLESNEQLVEEGQLRLLAALAARLQTLRGMTLRGIAEWLDKTLEEEGFAGLLGRDIGPDYAEVRGLDLVHMLNRIPGVRMGKTM